MSFNAKNTSGILLISKLKLTIIFVIVVVSGKYCLPTRSNLGHCYLQGKSCPLFSSLNNFGNSLLS